MQWRVCTATCELPDPGKWLCFSAECGETVQSNDYKCERWNQTVWVPVLSQSLPGGVTLDMLLFFLCFSFVIYKARA